MCQLRSLAHLLAKPRLLRRGPRKPNLFSLKIPVTQIQRLSTALLRSGRSVGVLVARLACPPGLQMAGLPCSG